MRTQTDTYQVFQYDELPTEKAKETARNWFRDGNEFPWFDEWRASITKGCEALGWTLKDWNVSSCGYSFAEINAGDDPAEPSYWYLDKPAKNWQPMRGVRLWKWLQGKDFAYNARSQSVAEKIGEEGSCPFTGYCGDEAFLEPLRAFLRKPDTSSTLQDLADACGEAWVRVVLNGIEFQNSDEVVEETIRANEYEFLENGARYKG